MVMYPLDQIVSKGLMQTGRLSKTFIKYQTNHGYLKVY